MTNKVKRSFSLVAGNTDDVPIADDSDVLRALRIAFERLDEPASVVHRIAEAQTLAYSSNKPVALLLCRDLMWEP